MSERDVQRRVTAAFIAADPYVVVLTPVVETITADGTKSTANGTPRPAQTVKMSELAYDQRPTITLNGQERVIDYHLIGLWNMAVAVGDWWEANGSRFEVMAVSDGFGYEKKVMVERHLQKTAEA